MPILSELATKVYDWAAGDRKPPKEKVEVELEQEELKKYKNWITLADKKHKDEVMTPAKKFMDRLKQKFPAATEDEIQCVFNYYKSNMSRIIPSLVPKSIKANIKVAQGQDSIQMQGGVFDNRRASVILNNKIDQILQDKVFKYAIREATYDLFVANLGTIVVGYESEVETENIPDANAEAVIAEKDANGEAIPGETPATETKVKSIGKMPKLTIKRESWKNVKMDPKATDFFFDNKRFAVRYVRKPLDEVKDLYGEIEETEIDEDIDSKSELSKMDEAKMAVMCELYDYTDGVRKLTFLGKGTRLVHDTKLSYDPLASCKLNYLPDEVYPPSDMVYYESQVDEANFYRTVRLNQISRGAARKILAESDVIDSDEEDKLMSNKDMELITAKPKQGRSLDSAIKVLEIGNINADLYNNQAQIAADIQEIANVSATRLGQVPNAPATNATLANNAYESGVSEKADILRDWMIQIIERAIAVLKEIAIEKEELVIERPDGTFDTISWSNEDIKYAKVIVDVDITADEPADSKLARIQAFINFITQPQISQMLGSDGYKVQMYEFVKEMGDYFIPDKNFDKFIVKSDQLMNPDRENILMMMGQIVQPQPQENFKEHLEAHSGFAQLPIMAQMPHVLPVLQQHIAQTQAIMNEQEQLKKAPVAPVQKEGPLASQAARVEPKGLLGQAQKGGAISGK